MSGWVLIHRQIRDNDYLWDDKPFTRALAWIDLIMLMEHEDKYSQKHKVLVKRGQHITTLNKLADRWGWGKTKVFDFLNSLQSAGMAKINANTKRTVVTIANYDFFQNQQTPSERKREHRANTERTPTLLNKETKETKEVKEESGASAPTHEKPQKHKYGEYGWVLLTDDEYGRLAKDHGKAVVEHYITYIDEAAEQTGNKNKWKNWNLVVRRAIKNKWGNYGRSTSRDEDYSFIDMAREEGLIS